MSGPDATLPLAAPRPAPPRGHRRPPHSAQAPTAFAGARRPGRGDAGCAVPRLVARTESWEEDALAGAAPPAGRLPRLRRGWRLQTGPRAATRGKDRAAPFRRLHTKRAFSRVALSRAADLNTENHGKCVLVQRLIIIIFKNVDRCLHLSYSANYGQGLNLVRKATCGCKLCASVVLGDSLGVPARVSPERAAPACGSLRTGRASSARCS